MTDKKEIERLIEAELAEANGKYPLFHSPHEAWAVLFEEFNELEVEVDRMQTALSEMFKEVMDDRELTHYINKIRRNAIYAACEAIQCAAMCDKAKQSNIL